MTLLPLTLSLFASCALIAKALKPETTVISLVVKDKRVPVAIIDTGIDQDYYAAHKSAFCEDGLVDLTGYGIFSHTYHATKIVDIVLQDFNISHYCLYVIRYHNPSGFGSDNIRNTIKAFTLVKTLGIRYVNYSAGGEYGEGEEKKQLLSLVGNNTKLFLSAGNEGSNLDEKCNYFPPCYFTKKNSNVHVVGSIDENNRRRGYSNYGSIVTHWRLSNGGTSFAAPIVLREVLNEDVAN